MKHSPFRHLLGGVLVVLAGCGGGGSSSTDSSTGVQAAGPLMTITSANYQTVSSESGNNVQEFAGQGSGAATLIGAETGSGSSTSRQALKALRIWQAAGPTPASLTGAVVNRTIACSVSGSIAGSFVDLNGSQDLDASGESVTLTFNSCNDGTGETYAGQFVAGLNATLQGDLATDVYAVDLSFTLRNFRSVSATSDLSANGQLRIAASSTSAGNTRATLSSPAFGASLTFGGVTRSFALHDMSFDVVEVNGASTVTYAGRLTSSQFNGNSVTFQTTTPLSYAANAVYPGAGVVVATGAGGARSTLTVVSTSQVRIDYDANGDNVAEQTALLNWNQIY